MLVIGHLIGQQRYQPKDNSYNAMATAISAEHARVVSDENETKLPPSMYIYNCRRHFLKIKFLPKLPHKI